MGVVRDKHSRPCNLVLRRCNVIVAYFWHLKKLLVDEVQKSHKEYNPNPGYEPYWPQGAWVFEDEEIMKDGSTTKMQLVCGEECHYLHKRIKDVCGRQVDYKYTNCYAPDCLLDILNGGFKSFDTYCEFLDQQCKETAKEKHWILVHAGRCVPSQNIVLKPVQKSSFIVNRMKEYYTRISQVFWEATLPSPL